MGADGGVCEIRVHDLQEFNQLVRPLGFVEFDSYHSSNEAWLDEHAETGHEYGTYGTSQSISLMDLPRTVSAIQDSKMDHGRSDLPKGLFEMTWREAALEIHTREGSPLKGVRYLWSSLDRVLGCNFRYVDDDFFEPGDHPLFDLTLEEWANRVQSACDLNSVYFEETWT